MPNYTPCAGTGQPATDIRLMRNLSGSAKYAHLAGKNAGKCAECGKGLTLGRGRTIAPAHKAVTDEERAR